MHPQSEIGYFCVDNLPIPLLERFADMIFEQPGGIGKAVSTRSSGVKGWLRLVSLYRFTNISSLASKNKIS